MDASRTPLHDYADEIGQYFHGHGLPRILGRILGWLLVCEPAHQSADELAEALNVSRGSVSMAVNSGQRSGFLQVHTVPGERRTYYRLRPGFWLDEAAEKARVANEWIKMVERGLGLLDGESAQRTQRLAEAHEMYTFLAEQYSRIETLWHERQKE